ncbi:hypothetical protein GCM10009092_10090 [Bowmanella denitrificans]|uniref:PDZ domain-containing protein n=1 Tax=Bowmanella denitrificans TaxID=366582 RepID=A0ABP3GNE3_9ALTE
MRNILLLISSILSASALANPSPPAWLAQGPYVDSDNFAISVPLDEVAGKLYVNVKIGGQYKRFVFDTGSPSMLSRELAEQLNLPVVDTRQGKDAHGTVVQTQIMQADLTLADLTFNKVPVYVADFPHTAKCLFDGVLGSELLPLCLWQIDTPGKALRCHSQPQTLNHLNKAQKLTLHNIGYPHMPILDIQFAKHASSKAMFDTGSAEYLTLSPQDFDGANRNQAIVKVTAGHGSLGSSLGGQAAVDAQRLASVKTLQLGELVLDNLQAPVREHAPSLLGSALLRHFIITLDSKSQAAYFKAYQQGPYSKEGYGFALSFESLSQNTQSYASQPSISLVWQDSPAAKAGLKVGQKVSAIDGMALNGSCDNLRQTQQLLSESQQLTLTLERQEIKLQKAAR